MKKTVLKKLLALVLSLILCFGAVSAATVSLAVSAVTSFSFDGCAVGASSDTVDTVNWHYNENDGKYYLFVPSTADLSALTVYFTASDDVYVGGVKLVSGEPTAVFSAAGEYTLSCGGTQYTLVVMVSGTVPAMYITTESGSLEAVHADKEHKEAGSMLLVSDGETEYDGALDYIKGRGNSTWRLAKKPYNIKLASKTDLFGMGKAKAWCLIASYGENSLVRNKGVYDLAEEVGLNYSSKSKHVDLYINNEYQGNYLLTEKVEVGSTRVDITDLEKLNEAANPDIDIEECELLGNRGAESAYVFGGSKWVNIPNNPADISGGYLLEFEQPNRYDPEISGFVTNVGQPVVIKSPEYASEAEVGYISSYYQKFEDALYSDTGYNSDGKYYTEYIDVDSMVKMYIMQELTMNLDAGTTSFYLYKNAGDDLIYASPVWDFDYSLGTPYPMQNVDFTNAASFWARIKTFAVVLSSEEILGTKVDVTAKEMNILTALCMHDDFLNMVADEWNSTFIPALDGIESELTELSQSISESAAMDAVLWNKFETSALAEVSQAYSDEVKTVTDFLTTKISFLTQQLVKNAVRLRYNANGGKGVVIDPYAYKSGDITTVADNSFVYPGMVFSGWNSEPDGSGIPYAAGNYIQLKGKTTLYAQWREETKIEGFVDKLLNFLTILINKIFSFKFPTIFSIGDK